MREHALQRCYPDCAEWDSRWQGFFSLPIPRLHDPDVMLAKKNMASRALTECRFLPADALWNLAMATNVYLTIFHKYSANRLKKLEWAYILACYGVTFIVALVPLFISNPSRGKLYGYVMFSFPPSLGRLALLCRTRTSAQYCFLHKKQLHLVQSFFLRRKSKCATDAQYAFRPNILWCSIDINWVFMRIAIVYGPAWACIATSLCIYALAGIEIFKKRAQLIQFKSAQGRSPRSRSSGVENLLTDFKTTHIEISSEPAGFSTPSDGSCGAIFALEETKGSTSPALAAACQPTRPSVITIIGSDPFRADSSNSIPVLSQSPQARLQRNKKKAAAEFNTAALAYTKVAMLFYVSMLITWVPPSVNRFNSLLHPRQVHVGSSYATSVTLPLMGFWNSVIYIFTSWNVVGDLFTGKLSRTGLAKGRSQSASRPRMYSSPWDRE